MGKSFRPPVSYEAGGLFMSFGGVILVNALPVIDMAATGANIAAMRKRAGLSVRDLQTIFGFSTPQAIYKWQRGDAMPTLDNIVALAAIFQVRVDDILVYREHLQVLIIA